MSYNKMIVNFREKMLRKLYIGSPSRYVELMFRTKFLCKNITKDVNKIFVKKK